MHSWIPASEEEVREYQQSLVRHVHWPVLAVGCGLIIAGVLTETSWRGRTLVLAGCAAIVLWMIVFIRTHDEEEEE